DRRPARDRRAARPSARDGARRKRLDRADRRRARLRVRRGTGAAARARHPARVLRLDDPPHDRAAGGRAGRAARGRGVHARGPGAGALRGDTARGRGAAGGMMGHTRTLAIAAATAASMVLIGGAAEYRDGYKVVLPPYRFSFPRDHASHPDFRIEWWYYTGI